MNCSDNKKCCCSNNKSCCKSKQNYISDKEYNELKKYLKEEIKDYKLIDYIDDNNNHSICVELEFKGRILELEGLDKNNLNLDNIIDKLIRNYNLVNKY